nr:alanine racemase [Haloarchaeobius sp. FL176]
MWPPHGRVSHERPPRDGWSTVTVDQYDDYRTALSDETLPGAFVDLDLLETNAATVRDRADGTPVRVASKSVRCRAVLDRVLAFDDCFQGLMCFSGLEAAHLAAHDFDDLLVAYPLWERAELDAVCDALGDGTDVQVMVDSAEHVDRVASVAREHDVTVPVILDVDMSTEHLSVHFGVRRSGVRSPAAALDVAGSIADADGVSFAGVMGYEAQLAGLPDDDPSNNRLMNAVVRFLKRRSRPRLRERRGAVVDALRDAGHEVSLVNGGGTGTVEFTAADPSVTEVTVGSGFYSPALFDHYRRFQHEPAAGFAVAVTRRPDPDIYTCRGGGYEASGPPGVDKQPVPTYPAGATLLDGEGAGEVQTPVQYDGPVDLSLGDPVVFRHAKAGELCERFRDLHLVRDGAVVETVPTYRGDGRCFL